MHKNISTMHLSSQGAPSLLHCTWSYFGHFARYPSPGGSTLVLGYWLQALTKHRSFCAACHSPNRNKVIHGISSYTLPHSQISDHITLCIHRHQTACGMSEEALNGKESMTQSYVAYASSAVAYLYYSCSVELI